MSKKFLKKYFLLAMTLTLMVSIASPVSMVLAQTDSGGNLTNATIAGASGMQYVGQSSSAAKRTVSWTRLNEYDGAVNVYYAHNSDITGGCATPDPTDPDWNVTSGVNLVGSTFVWNGADIGGLPNGTDYCLLIRSATAATPWAVTDQFEIDNTVPAITSRQTQDLNGNGKIDAMKITFNDEILDSTVRASDFDIDGYSNEAFSSTTNGDVANNNVIYITFTEGANSDTNATPNVTYTAGTLTDLADNALASNGPIASTDLAKPVIVQADWKDATADGKIDQVVLTFSEQVDVADGNSGDGLDSIFIHNGAVLKTIDNADYAESNQTALTLNFTGDPVDSTAITGLTITYSAAGNDAITDNATPSSNEVADSDVAESYIDSALPVFKSSTTADLDGNGTVDQITIVYSETVSIADGSGLDGFPGVTFGNSCVAANADYASIGTTSSVVAVTGCTIGDTSITANPTYTAASGDIKDVSSSHNEMTEAETVTGTDGAAPAIISSTGSDSDNDGKTNSYTITFSEALADRGAAAGNVNFTAKNNTTSQAITVLTVDIGNATSNQVVLNLDDDDTDNYTGVVSFSYNKDGGGAKISDKATPANDFASVTDKSLTDDVKPVLLSSRGGNNGGTADVLDNDNEIIDFRFSEPMNTTPPTIANLESGLTFAGGATDGNNLGNGTNNNTVTRVTLSTANDTYRVTRTASDSTNLITPGTDTVKVSDGANIKDLTGNAANTVPAAVTISVADIVPPTISSRNTQDLDGNGKIDAIQFIMDEAITDTTINIANFATSHALGFDADFASESFGGFAWANGVSTGVTPNDATFYLKLNESAQGDTDATPTTTYTQGTLADVSTNLLASDGAAVVSTDKAAPVAMSALYKDTGVADGQVDSVDITFSENVTLTLYADGDWTVPTAGTISLNDETGAVASGKVITLSALGASDKTGGLVNPQITYTNGGSNNVNDGHSNNTSTFTIAATDDAAPIVVSQKYLDANGDGQVDAVELTLSENQAFCTATAGDFTYVANDITGSVLAGGSVACATNKVTITLGTPGDFGKTSHATAPTIAYTDDPAREISDSTGHQLATSAVLDLADGAGPVVTAISITDSSGDGIIDQANLTYSENLQDTVSGANGFEVTSVLNHGNCTGETADPTASASLALNFTCTNVYTAVGDLTIGFSTNTGIVDTAGNQSPSVSLTGASTPVYITDAAKPVMASAASKDSNHDGTVDALLISFSEPVNITDPGDDGYITLSGVMTVVARDYSGTGVTSLLLGVAGTTLNNTSITINPTYHTGATGTITDGTNEIANNNTVAGIDGAEPVILSATFNDTDANGNIDSVDLSFSEQVNVADGEAGDGFDSVIISDAGGTLEIDDGNYAGSVTTLTLPFADHTGTSIDGLTVVYNTLGDDAIVDVTKGNEIINEQVALTYVDAAAPVPMTASIDKAIVNLNLQSGAVITVVFSENITIGTVVDADWKFARNGFETLAQANWPDNGPTGPDVDYGTDGTNKLTMTLAGATTSSAWMNGARLNLNADNTTSITDSALNKADKNNANIAITGLNGPIIGYPGAENITSSSATISWTTGSNTTGNRVLYDTKANYEISYSLGQQSVAGYPGDGTRNHSINLSGLAAGTIYYYNTCSTELSESCAQGTFTTLAAGDTTPPTVIGQSPEDEETDVSSGPIYIDFSEPIAVGTITSDTIKLCEDDEGVPGSTCIAVFLLKDINTDGGTRVLYAGDYDLEPETTYWLIATTGVTDVAGNPLAAEYQGSFTTAAAPVVGLSVDSVKLVGYGTTNGGWNNPFEWIVRVTMPANQQLLAFQFDNWTNGLNTANNMRYWSEEINANASGGSNHPILITAANTYISNILVTGDASPAPGIQTNIHVQLQIPGNTPAGAHSTTFKVRSTQQP